ncbi:MAG TPA: hypothetical protein HPP87_10470 [Planctomycetes bacterium]|nr:hypothetical protein [Planctomycetota bacterium]
MARCNVCGRKNESLPKTWVNWECPQCFHDRFTSYINPTDSKIAAAMLTDLQEKQIGLIMRITDLRIVKITKEADERNE